MKGKGKGELRGCAGPGEVLEAAGGEGLRGHCEWKGRDEVI